MIRMTRWSVSIQSSLTPPYGTLLTVLSLSHKSPSLIYAKTVMTMSDSDKINWCVIRHNISSFSRKRESTEGGFGRRVTSETASVFDRHDQAVEPPSWDIIAPPFTGSESGVRGAFPRPILGCTYEVGLSAATLAFRRLVVSNVRSIYRARNRRD